MVVKRKTKDTEKEIIEIKINSEYAYLWCITAYIVAKDKLDSWLNEDKERLREMMEGTIKFTEKLKSLMPDTSKYS
jgi:hypothetical protein